MESRLSMNRFFRRMTSVVFYGILGLGLTTMGHEMKLRTTDKTNFPPRGKFAHIGDEKVKVHYILDGRQRKTNNKSEEVEDQKSEVTYSQQISDPPTKRSDTITRSNSIQDSNTSVLNQNQPNGSNDPNRVTIQASPSTGKNDRDIMVIMIPDIGCSSEVFVPLKDRFLSSLSNKGNKNVHCLLYDRPGYGNSGIATGERSAGKCVKELHELLKSICQDHPEHSNSTKVLVGHGFGAWIARLYRDQHPHDVNTIVLINPTHEKYHLKNPQWRNVENSICKSFLTQEIMTNFGLMEILLKIPFYYWTRTFYNYFENDKHHLDHKGAVGYHIRQKEYWRTRFREMVSSIPSAREVFLSRKMKQENQQDGGNEFGLVIIHASDDNAAGRSHFKQAESEINVNIYQELMSMTNTTTTTPDNAELNEWEQYNHFNVLSSENLQKKLVEVIDRVETVKI